MWSIIAKAFPLSATPFRHNFWLLTDGAGNAVEQLHGLAVHPGTGKAKAVGNSSDYLMALRFKKLAWTARPDLPAAVCAHGDEAEILPRWQAAVDAAAAINNLRLPYPSLWRHFHQANSNSVFSTLGQVMGFSGLARLLPGWAPGIRLVISQEIIDQYSLHFPATSGKK